MNVELSPAESEISEVIKGTAGALEEIGTTGLRQSGGLVLEERLARLRGAIGREQLREMADNDPVVGASLLALDLIARQVDWRTEPHDGDDDDEMAAWVEEARLDMSHTWSDLMSAALTMLPFGWSWHEIVYKRRTGWSEDGSKRSKFKDGRLGWRKWPLRSQDSLDRWQFDPEDGALLGMWQRRDYLSKAPVFIPIERALHFRTVAIADNPEGRSVLRNAWTSYYNKRRIVEIEGIGLERDLAGLPVGWVPMRWLSDKATDAEKSALDDFTRTLGQIRTDEQSFVIMPQQFDDRGNKMFDLTLLTTGGRRQFDIDPVIARYDQRIAMTTLADFLLLGHEQVGSFALGGSKIDLFTSSIVARLDQIGEVISTHGVPRLLKLNGMDPERAPSVVHGDLHSVDLTELGEFVAKVSTAGAVLFPDPDLENYLRTVAHLPPKSAEAQALQDEEAAQVAAAAQAQVEALNARQQAPGKAPAQTEAPAGPEGEKVDPEADE